MLGNSILWKGTKIGKLRKVGNFHLLKGNIIGKLRKVGNFHLLHREYIRKTSKRSKIYIGNVGKNRICPSQMWGNSILWKGNIIGKLRKVGVFHPFKRKHDRKITKSRGFPSFEKCTQSENFETVENLHRKCWKKPKMSIANVKIIFHHPNCLVCATRWSWCNFPSILVTV